MINIAGVALPLYTLSHLISIIPCLAHVSYTITMYTMYTMLYMYHAIMYKLYSSYSSTIMPWWYLMLAADFHCEHDLWPFGRRGSKTQYAKSPFGIGTALGLPGQNWGFWTSPRGPSRPGERKKKYSRGAKKFPGKHCEQKMSPFRGSGTKRPPRPPPTAPPPPTHPRDGACQAALSDSADNLPGGAFFYRCATAALRERHRCATPACGPGADPYGFWPAATPNGHGHPQCLVQLVVGYM